MNISNSYKYQTDILGEDYQQLTLNFADDYDGKVVATLVRKKSAQATKKAVLYIHGFSDYFFQTEMAEQFNQHGYDFYALDLRKYGRSKLPHQSFIIYSTYVNMMLKSLKHSKLLVKKIIIKFYLLDIQRAA
jgi:alpha-beta hydrolase superfamily lysophospholipase